VAIKAVSTIKQAIASAIMELMLERGVLLSRKMQIESIGTFKKEIKLEMDQYMSKMEEAHFIGDTNQWNLINESFQHNKKHSEQIDSAIKKLTDEQNAELLVFIRKCIDKSLQISELTPDVVLAFRDELNLPIAKDTYKEICKNNLEQGKRLFEELYKIGSGSK
jgi:hypothetical protein